MMIVRYFLKCSRLAWLVVIFFACQSQKEPTLFQLVPASVTGVTFSNDLNDTPELNIIEYLYYYNGGGVAIADINNDGLEDILFTGNQVPNRLYLNLGDFKFQDITEIAGINIQKGWTTGVTSVDINQDGWMDFYICQVAHLTNEPVHNLLYINNGDLTFTEQAAGWGLDFKGYSTQAAFFDYDQDGDLDMYLLNHAVHTIYSYQPAHKREVPDSLSGDRLYQSQLAQGKQTYHDVTSSAGIYSGAQGFGLGLVISDINQDGWPDIYVGNDFHENDFLYINQQDGTFLESLQLLAGHTSRFTMGVDIADMTGNGLFDIFTLDMLPMDAEILLKSGGEDTDKVSAIKLQYGYMPQSARNAFHVNMGHYFADIALMTETYATDWSWSVLLEDFDMDGQRDIYITNGIYKRPNDLDYINFLSNINLTAYAPQRQDSLKRELIARLPSVPIGNVAFRQRGKYDFERVQNQWGLGQKGFSNGAAYADLDDDGDLDLVVNNINEPAFLYRNNAIEQTNANYLKIVPVSDKVLLTGIRAELYSKGKKMVRENYPVRGFQSAVSPVIYFALDKAAIADSLILFWPDGLMSVDYNVKANQTLIVDSKQAKRIQAVNTKSDNLNTAIELSVEIQEDDFKDSDREVLIPHKLSMQGPAVAVGVSNGDNFEDIFIGGAHGIAGQLLKYDGTAYVSKTFPAFDQDRHYEDVSAVWLDWDGDGDLDLYVGSGGNVYPHGSPLLEDRLYINELNGGFKRANITLPKSNTGVVITADFDQDGRPDVFVGTMGKPGNYGQSAESYVILNKQKGPEMLNLDIGIVTSADYHDKTKRLVVAGEWMPIKIYGFETGKPVLQQSIPKTSGMWQVVKWIDINGDGKSDIVAGNLGLNSKLKASASEPLRLFVGDMDKNGQTEAILFHDFFGQNIPFASKDQLISQIPMLKKEYVSYVSFAQVRTIEQLLGKARVRELTQLEIEELRSCFFIAKHEGSYEKNPLPIEVQMSQVCDFFIENDQQLYWVGNFLGGVANRGRYDAMPGGVIHFSKEGKMRVQVLSGIRHDLAYRRICAVNGNLLLVPNQGKLYVLREELDF